jgi:hypothetical protein
MALHVILKVFSQRPSLVVVAWKSGHDMIMKSYCPRLVVAWPHFATYTGVGNSQWLCEQLCLEENSKRNADPFC